MDHHRTSHAVRLGGAVLISVGLFLAQVSQFSARKSVTFDETIYCALAQSSIAERRVDPRLASLGVAPLPVLTTHVPANWHRGRMRESYLHGAMDDPPRVRAARWWTVVLWSIPLILIVACWVYARRGMWPSLVAASLVAASPSLIAHGALATTDMAATTTLVGLAVVMAAALRRPTLANIFLYAVVWGFAVGAKYTAVVGIVPAAVLIVRWKTSQDAKHGVHWPRAIGLFLLVVVVCGTVTWACHGFAWAKTAPPLTRDLYLNVPSPLAGILAQARHQSSGHAAYLLGTVRTSGWWYYFPVAIFCKSTLVELPAIFGALAGSAVLLTRRCTGRDSADPAQLAVALLIVLIWLAMSMSRVNIGHRYMLPVYPLSIFLAVDWLASRRGARVILLLATLAQVAFCVAQAPHHLAYFSPAVGGSTRGHQWLGDSNLDWGQDLRALREWWQKQHRPSLRLKYFGTADPRAEGLPWGDHDFRARKPLTDSRYLAVSVTILQGIYERSPYVHDQVFTPAMARALLREQPVARAGYSIWIFDTSQPRIRAILDMTDDE